MVGQRGSHDLAGVGIQADVELAPRPPHLGAVLLDQPLAWPAQLQPRAVHQEVHRFAVISRIGAAALPRHLQRRGPAAQGRVIRHREIEPEQADDGADQPFGLAQPQAEHGPERQGRQDGEGRIAGLPAPGGAWLGRPRRDRLIGEPHRQAPTLAQAGVIGRPVRDPVLLPGNVATAGLVQLEGQEGHPGIVRGDAVLRHPALQRQPPEPCTTAPTACTYAGRQSGGKVGTRMSGFHH